MGTNITRAATTSRRPAWVWVTVAGVGLIAVALLVFLIGTFIPSASAVLAAVNLAVAIAALGALVAAVGVIWRLLRGRQ